MFRYRKLDYFFILTVFTLLLAVPGCNYTTHRILTNSQVKEEEDPEPNYSVTLDENYQNFVSYMYMGNRAEAFGTFFNKFYTALEDYNDALAEYRTSTIAEYNRRLDSLNITPPLSAAAKEKLNKVIERCSKIIQFNKSTRFLDGAVLLIGKSYYYLAEYLQAERKFSEFLSKLTVSKKSDEALLYLARTEFKLGKNTEAETILLNLLKNTKDREILSEISQDLGINSLTKNDYESSVDYFKKSIEYAVDKDKKAEKQYILAKIYTLYKPAEAYKEYEKAFDMASDFDLRFYSTLNKAKALSEKGDYKGSLSILKSISGKYRDYPEFKQLIEFEIGNTLFLQKDFKEAKKHYYDVIVNYTGTKSAADAYYHLAYWYEKYQNNYFNAFIDYKKVTETNSTSDYFNVSQKKMHALEKYYNLLAVILDKEKGIIPAEDPDIQKMKEKLEKEKNPTREKNPLDPGKGQVTPPPKGGGIKYKISFNLVDSVMKKGMDSTKTTVKDTIKTTVKDTTEKTPPVINQDSLNKAAEKWRVDSTRTAQRVNDSLSLVKEELKVNALFELAELFLYEFNRTDSTIIYLNKVISSAKSPDMISKAIYTLANVYKNQGDKEESNKLFNKVIEQYPLTVYANESRKILGIKTIETAIDTTESLYKNCENEILNRNYDKALSDLKGIINNYPESKYEAKVLYSIGWIYENYYSSKDSALLYYVFLKNKFPNSEFTSSIRIKYEFLTAPVKSEQVDSSGTLKDTVKMIIDESGEGTDISNKPADTTKKIQNNDDGGNPPPEKKKIEEKKDEKMIKPKEINPDNKLPY